MSELLIWGFDVAIVDDLKTKITEKESTFFPAFIIMKISCD
jgi:hypothetical protein